MAVANQPEKKTLWQGQAGFYLTGGTQCRGCGSLLAAKLALRAIYEKTSDALVFGRSCGGGRSELQTGGRIALDGSGMLGIMTASRLRHERDRPLVVISGDGRTLDMGFGDFCGAFDRNQKLTWIILDNQAYASSGSHSTATTPLKARTRVFTKGKPLPEKNVPLMMMHGNARYVATATPAYFKDYVRKVQRALETTPSYVHVVVPCQVSWRYRPQEMVLLSRLLVQTGLLPLWEYDGNSLARTVKIPPASRVPVAEYLSRQGRFEGATEEDVSEILDYVESTNKLIDRLEKT